MIKKNSFYRPMGIMALISFVTAIVISFLLYNHLLEDESWGLVAKVDLVEIQAYVLKFGFIAMGIFFSVLLVGGIIFLYVSKSQFFENEKNECKERLKRVVTYAPIPIMIHAQDGEILELNNMWTQLSGYSKDEINSTANWNQLIVEPQKREEADEMLKKAFNTESFIKHEGVKFRDSKNSEQIWDYLSVPLCTLDDGRDCVITSALNLTERKKIEDEFSISEQRFKKILESSNEGFLMVDNDGKFLDVNEAMCDLLLSKRGQLIDHKMDEFLDQKHRKVFQGQMSFQDKNISSSFVMKIIQSNGNVLTCLFNATPMYDHLDSQIGSFAMVTDVSDLINKERELSKVTRELRILNRDLEEEVKKRTIELESAFETAELANNAKSIFLSNISHELRTPLNAIMGFSDMLVKEYFGKLNEKQNEYVVDIFDSGKHLLNIINDILDISKIEAGKMTLDISDVSIWDMIASCLAMMSQKITSKKIHFEFIGDEEEVANLNIKADALRMKQVLLNLLSNAVKFVSEEGNVAIDAKVDNSPSGPGSIIISVIDNGEGIDIGDQEKIFDEFYQVEKAMSEKSQGTGLGLPLTRKLIHLHGGDIRVESEGEGKGSRFIVSLPIQREIQS